MKLSKNLQDMIENAGFKISDEDDNYISFQKYSPYGHDFNFEIYTEDNLRCFCNNILSYYYAFDLSYEAYLWLDDMGHGKNGAPYEMIDVYKDMEACKEFVYELYQIVNKYIESIADVKEEN